MIPAVLLFGVAEITSRYVTERDKVLPALFNLTKFDTIRWDRIMEQIDELREIDPYSGYRLRPPTDPRSRRPPHFPMPQKEPGEVRVLCIGDSTTYGLLVPEQEAYPARLEAHLNEWAPAGVRFRVINGGIPGYDPLQSKRLLQSRYMQAEPDVILWHEHTLVRDSLDLPPPTPVWRIRLEQLVFRSRFVFLAATLSRIYLANEDPENVIFNKRTGRTSDNPNNVLPRLVEWSKERGVKAFLGVEYLYLADDGTGQWVVEGNADEWESEVRLAYIRCADQFRKQRPDPAALFGDTCHLTAEGEDLLARIIFNDLRKRWPDLAIETTPVASGTQGP